MRGLIAFVLVLAALVPWKDGLAAEPTEATEPAQVYQRAADEIQALRAQIREAYGTPAEGSIAPLLRRELAAGERMIRSARSLATDAQMHAIIQFAAADRDLLFSLLAREGSDSDLAKLGIEYEVTFRARYAREQFQAVFQWKSALARDRPDVLAELRSAQNRFTAAAVLPSFEGGFSRERLEAAEAAVEQIEKKIFENGGIRREIQFPPSSDILTDLYQRHWPLTHEGFPRRCCRDSLLAGAHCGGGCDGCDGGDHA